MLITEEELKALSYKERFDWVETLPDEDQEFFKQLLSIRFKYNSLARWTWIKENFPGEEHKFCLYNLFEKIFMRTHDCVESGFIDITMDNQSSYQRYRDWLASLNFCELTTYEALISKTTKYRLKLDRKIKEWMQIEQLELFFETGIGSHSEQKLYKKVRKLVFKRIFSDNYDLTDLKELISSFGNLQKVIYENIRIRYKLDDLIKSKSERLASRPLVGEVQCIDALTRKLASEVDSKDASALLNFINRLSEDFYQEDKMKYLEKFLFIDKLIDFSSRVEKAKAEGHAYLLNVTRQTTIPELALGLYKLIKSNDLELVNPATLEFDYKGVSLYVMWTSKDVSSVQAYNAKDLQAVMSKVWHDLHAYSLKGRLQLSVHRRPNTIFRSYSQEEWQEHLKLPKFDYIKQMNDLLPHERASIVEPLIERYEELKISVKQKLLKFFDLSINNSKTDYINWASSLDPFEKDLCYKLFEDKEITQLRKDKYGQWFGKSIAKYIGYAKQNFQKYKSKFPDTEELSQYELEVYAALIFFTENGDYFYVPSISSCFSDQASNVLSTKLCEIEIFSQLKRVRRELSQKLKLRSGVEADDFYEWRYYSSDCFVIRYLLQEPKFRRALEKKHKQWVNNSIRDGNLVLVDYFVGEMIQITKCNKMTDLDKMLYPIWLHYFRNDELDKFKEISDDKYFFEKYYIYPTRKARAKKDLLKYVNQEVLGDYDLFTYNLGVESSGLIKVLLEDDQVQETIKSNLKFNIDSIICI